MWTYPHKTADLLTLIKQILNGNVFNVNIITESFNFFFKPNCQSLVSFTSINTYIQCPFLVLARNNSTFTMADAWDFSNFNLICCFWLVNCIRFNWTITVFFILTKLFAYTFFLKDISSSLIFVMQKHSNF